ncbi:MAG TPA: hypothetical protein VIU82_25135 [Bosea sp. (in: a-proteobacteria)]
MDLETRSTCDLVKKNGYCYFSDPSTEIICLAWAFGDEEPVLWWPGEPCPDRIRWHIEAGGLCAAFNANFERLAFRDVLGPRHGWPVPKTEQWRCVMVMGMALGLPAKLDQMAPALKLPIAKDNEGHRLMLSMCKPRKARKGERPEGVYWIDDPEKMARLGQYALQDVRTEQAIMRCLTPLKASEQKLWELDARMNDRGVYIDENLCLQAQKVVAQTQIRLDEEMRQVTGMAVRGVSNVGELTAFCRQQGVDASSVAKDDLAELLVRDDLTPAVRRALEIRQEGAKTSVAKIGKLLACRQADGRMRGNLQFHGASTGRWCLTGDSEVLTRDGWVRLDAYSGGEIMQWSPDRRVAFAPAEAQSFPFQGNLLRLHHAMRMDARMTFEHTMPSFDEAGRFKPTTALALRGEYRKHLPLSGTLSSPPAVSTLQTRILVMLQHDGYDGEYDVEWTFVKQRKSTRCQKLLASAGIKFICKFDENYARWRIRVRRDDAPAWLVKRDFGAWLLQEGHDPRAFIDECQHWDGGGHDKEKNLEVCCAKRVNAEWTVTMAHLAGKCGVVTERTQPANGRTYFYANIRAQQVWSKGRRDDTVEPYSGPVYCPATVTGFFLCRTNGLIWISGNSARGAQLQNLPRPTVDAPMDDIVADLRKGDAARIEMLYGPAMTVVSDAIRGMIAAPPGRKMLAADLSQIEARITAWFGGQHDKLEAFRRYDAGLGPDVYTVTAAGMYGVPASEIGKSDPRRQGGKTGDLACGFQGGAGAILKMAKNYGLDLLSIRDTLLASASPEAIEAAEEAWIARGKASGVFHDRWTTAELIKIAWRKANPATAAMWRTVEDAAIAAVKEPGTLQTAGKLRYRKAGSWLHCCLPSGRVIAYAFPSVRSTETPFKNSHGEPIFKDKLYFWAVDSFSKKWSEQGAYGGLLFQNGVQAAARDVMAGGMKRAEAAGYDLCLTVHDENVAEADANFGSADEFGAFLTEGEPWMAGLPVAAEAFSAERYRK